jgi:hypothetical protein
MARKQPTNHQKRRLMIMPALCAPYVSAQKRSPIPAARAFSTGRGSIRRSEATRPKSADPERRSFRDCRRAAPRRCGTLRSLIYGEGTELDCCGHVAGACDFELVEEPVAQSHDYKTNGAMRYTHFVFKNSKCSNERKVLQIT